MGKILNGGVKSHFSLLELISVLIYFSHCTRFTVPWLPQYFRSQIFHSLRASIKCVIFQQVEIAKCIKELYAYHDVYFAVLRCLHALTSSLPQNPLGKKVGVNQLMFLSLISLRCVLC